MFHTIIHVQVVSGLKLLIAKVTNHSIIREVLYGSSEMENAGSLKYTHGYIK